LINSVYNIHIVYNIYIYIHVYTRIYLYIYIKEGEREREREKTIYILYIHMYTILNYIFSIPFRNSIFLAVSVLLHKPL